MDYDGPDGFQQYMHDLEAANEDILDLELIGQSHGTDPEGDADSPREIIAVRLTADEESSVDGSKPAVLYSSLIHAREWIAGEVNRRLLEWFIKGWLARRDLDNDGDEDAITLNYSIDGGPAQTGSTAEWDGGDRYGGAGDVY